MWKQSVWTSVLAAQISSKHLKEYAYYNIIAYSQYIYGQHAHDIVYTTPPCCFLVLEHSGIPPPPALPLSLSLSLRGGLLLLTGAQAALQGTAGDDRLRSGQGCRSPVGVQSGSCQQWTATQHQCPGYTPVSSSSSTTPHIYHYWVAV